MRWPSGALTASESNLLCDEIRNGLTRLGLVSAASVLLHISVFGRQSSRVRGIETNSLFSEKSGEKNFYEFL